jgi:hypothetical protein
VKAGDILGHAELLASSAIREPEGCTQVTGDSVQRRSRSAGTLRRSTAEFVYTICDLPLIRYLHTFAVAWTLADLADVPVRPSGANAGASSGRQ